MPPRGRRPGAVASGAVITRLERWEAASRLPLTVAAIAFFVAFALPILWYPGMPAAVATACVTVTSVTWTMFVVDFAIRLVLSGHPLRYVRRHWLDVLVVVMPMFRPLQLVPLLSFFNAANKRASARLRGQVMTYVTVCALTLALVGTLAVLQAERGASGATITTVGVAAWWVFETMTTVGYGDYTPVTPMGRTFAVILMISGIAVLSSVTAGISSWITEPVQRPAGDASGTSDAAGSGLDVQAAVSDDVTSAVMSELHALRAELADLRAHVRTRPAEPPAPPD